MILRDFYFLLLSFQICIYPHLKKQKTNKKKTTKKKTKTWVSYIFYFKKMSLLHNLFNKYGVLTFQTKNVDLLDLLFLKMNILQKQFIQGIIFKRYIFIIEVQQKHNSIMEVLQICITILSEFLK